jgi:hypothetical protein
MLINNYQAGDVFTLNVIYSWMDSTGKDYTVKLYSSLDDIQVTDAVTGESNIIYMDGRSPSGFRNSKFAGMGTPKSAVKIDMSKEQYSQ